MMRSLYSGVAGLKAHQTEMDVIGNNIANVNTYGFKMSRVTFRDVYYQTLAGASAGNGVLGGSNPTQIGYGSNIASVDVINSQSGMATTGQSSDLYIDGEGYFVIQDGVDTDGNSTYLYTRVGSLSFDGEGNLVDGNKRIVCGGNADSSGEVTIDPENPEPIKIEDDLVGKLGSFEFSADGTITGVNSEDGTVVTIGKIALADIPNPQGLTQIGGSYYKAMNNTGVISCYAPGEGTVGSLVPGSLETSNVDLANEFAQMIITQRGFQANSKIITVSDEMLETLVGMKR